MRINLNFTHAVSLQESFKSDGRVAVMQPDGSIRISEPADAVEIKD